MKITRQIVERLSPSVAAIRAHVDRWHKRDMRARMEIPGMRITKRALVLGMFGGVALATISTERSFATFLKGHLGSTSAPPASPIPDVGPSNSWTGVGTANTAGNGFGAGNGIAEPTPSAPRAITDRPRPSLGEFGHLRTNSVDEVLGAQCDFGGVSGGIQKVQIIAAGLSFDIPNRTTNTYFDPFDQTFNTQITNYLWHWRFKASLFFAQHAGGGGICYYLKGIPTNAGADPIIKGPYIFTMKPGLVAAPWDTTGKNLCYDALYTVDVNASVAGNNYHFVDDAMQAAVNASKTSALISCPNDGAYPLHTNNITGAVPTHATQWITIAADPRTCVTGIWMDNHAGPAAAAGWAPGYDGVRFLGGLTILDSAPLGTGTVPGQPGQTTGWSTIGCGVSPITNPNQAMCFEGCTWTTGAGPTSPTILGWNGLTGLAALYAGYGGGNFILSSVRLLYVLETHVHDIGDGLVGNVDGTTSDPYPGVNGNHARNCIINNSTKPMQNYSNSYNCTVTNCGIFNGPDTVAQNAFTIWSSLPTPTMQTEGQGGASTGLTLYSAGAQQGSTIDLTLYLTQSLQDVVTAVNAITGFHAALVATLTTSRAPGTLWYPTLGAIPLTAAGAGIGRGSTGNDTPVAISTSSGSPTMVQTINAPHVDMITWNGTGSSVFQNLISEGYSVNGKKGGKWIFFVTAASFLDTVISSYVCSDDLSTLGPNYVGLGGSDGGPGPSPQSNVVIKNSSIVGSETTFIWFNGYVGDIWCAVFNIATNTASIAGGAVMTGTQISGIAVRQASTVTGDSNGISLFSAGVAIPYASIFTNPLGTSPYGYGGSGVAANLAPINGTILLAANGQTIGAYTAAGVRKVAA